MPVSPGPICILGNSTTRKNCCHLFYTQEPQGDLGVMFHKYQGMTCRVIVDIITLVDIFYLLLIIFHYHTNVCHIYFIILNPSTRKDEQNTSNSMSSFVVDIILRLSINFLTRRMLCLIVSVLLYLNIMYIGKRGYFQSKVTSFSKDWSIHYLTPHCISYLMFLIENLKITEENKDLVCSVIFAKLLQGCFSTIKFFS